MAYFKLIYREEQSANYVIFLIILFMNLQTQWKVIADKQQSESMQRIRQQQLYKQKLKQAYMAELSNQLKVNEELKKREKSLERWQDKSLVDQSIENHKKQIETEMTRVKLLNERQEKIQFQNQMLERKKREQAEYIKRVQQQMQLQGTQQAYRAEQLRKMQQARRKQEQRKQMLDSIQMNKQYRSLTQRYEKQFQKQQLNEGQTRKLKDQIERLRFYHQLRERSKMVDYGSHNAFQEKNNKTLVQRKKQEWQTYKDSIEMQQKIKQTQEQARINRLMLENQYRNELKRQIQNRSKASKQKSSFQLQSDRRTISYSQQLSDKAYQQQRQREEHQKKMLGQFLLYQADSKTREKQIAEEMKDHQMRMNLGILNQNNNISSMDTYQLDPYRKKQLQVIEKSLNPSRYNTVDYAENSRLTYFANKGINIIK